jgi:hypothetical protein
MNHYYLEKMIETTQKELDQVSRKSWKSTVNRSGKGKFFKRFFSSKTKTTNKSKQVCCA